MNREVFVKPKTVVSIGVVTIVALVAVVANGVERFTSESLIQSAKWGFRKDVALNVEVTQPSSAIFQEETGEDFDWKTDPVCRAIFDAVLAGLHRDKVSDKIVANVIGKKSKKKDAKTLRERMKRSFVLDCPLCEPTFEAFLTYQMRDKSRDTKIKVTSEKNSGRGIKKEMLTGLLSETSGGRVVAIAKVAKGWISVKLESQNQLKPEEIQAWKERIHMRAAEGKDKLMELKKTDENYKIWSLYTGCGACNGAMWAVEGWDLD